MSIPFISNLFKQQKDNFRTAFSDIKIPKEKNERDELLRVTILKMSKLDKEIDSLEDDYSYRYSLDTDDKFETFIRTREFEDAHPEYFEKLIEQRETINLRLKLESEYINIRKGIFIGFAVDLLNLDKYEPLYISWDKWENHAQVVGTTRYGKSYLLASLAFQMIKKKANLIIVDPKAGVKQELLSWMIEFALIEEREDDIVFTNPAYVEYSDLYNPVYGMSSTEIASTLAKLAEGDGVKPDEFFSSITYIVGLGICKSFEFLEIANDPDGSLTKLDSTQELVKYRKIVDMRGTELERYDKVTKMATPDYSSRMNNVPEIDRGEDNRKVIFSRTLINFEDIANYCRIEDMLKLQEMVEETIVPNRNEISNRRYQEMMEAKKEALLIISTITALGDFYNKISMSIVSLLLKLSTGEIGKLFGTIRINPILNRLTSQERGLIAVIQPAPLRYGKVSDMIVKVQVKSYESLFGRISVTGRGMRERVYFLIDEGKTALFNGIEEIYNKAGGMKMSVLLFIQSERDKVVKVGEDIARVISDNTNVNIYMKTNDPSSKEEIVKSFGTKRKHTKTIQSQESMTRISVMSMDEYLLTTSDIDSLSKGQGFVSVRGNKYLVNFAFRLPPQGEIIMPSIKGEEELRDLVIQEDTYEVFKMAMEEAKIGKEEEAFINKSKEIKERFSNVS